MKVICAGLQKTGTKSLAKALRILGYNVHDVYEQYSFDRELWEKVRSNTATVEDYRRVLCDVDAVSDIPACGLWDEIFNAFPDAKVILTVRSSEEEWCGSVKRHCRYMYQHTRFGVPNFLVPLIVGPKYKDYKEYQDSFMLGCVGYNVIQKEVPIEAMLRIKYRQHNAYVQSTCPKQQLLVFNVKDGWDPLCEFLNASIPEEPFPVVNVDGEMVHQVVAGKYPDYGLVSTIKRQTAVRLCFTLIVFIAFLSFLFQLYTV